MIPQNILQALMQNCGNQPQQTQNLQRNINSVRQIFSQPNFNPQQFAQEQINKGNLSQDRLNWAMQMADKFYGRR